jgi:hypothetical protein
VVFAILVRRASKQEIAFTQCDKFFDNNSGYRKRADLVEHPLSSGHIHIHILVHMRILHLRLYRTNLILPSL